MSMSATSQQADLSLAERLRRLPKAELHLHIEGTLEPEQMFEFAERNGLTPPFASVEAARAAYNFQDLQSFLDLYYAGSDVLRTSADFEDLTLAWCRRAAADGVRRAEVFFDPQAHTARGLTFEAVMDGLLSARARAQHELGMSVDYILCFLRHLSEEDALATWAAAQRRPGAFIGVGLDSSERGNPPEKFARVFAKAAEAGLYRVAHAGEEGPPAYITGALDVLGVARIDHGVRCLDDPAVTARLAAARTPLTVCPLSNVRLCVFPTIEQHNLKRLLDAGLCVTVNSDDPAYFGGYLLDNYLAVAQGLGLSWEEVCTLVRNSWEASFLPEEERQHWMQEVR